METKKPTATQRLINELVRIQNAGSSKAYFDGLTDTGDNEDETLGDLIKLAAKEATHA